MTSARILVVEDDPAILTAVAEKLRMEGHEVLTAVDGEDARIRIADEPLDLVILDIMLPKLDGLSVLRWLRRKSGTLPVLILSARGQEDEKVEGLQAGADDYLAKPFGLRELMARVDALLRRSHGPAKTLTFGSVKIDFEWRKVFLRKAEVDLSRKELEVLLFLARNRDRVLSREEIHSAVWGHYASSGDRAVDYHILHLRRKLEEDPTEPRYIVTRHGLGYQFVL